MRMPPLPADSIHARACKLKCEKILTRPRAETQLAQEKHKLERLENRKKYLEKGERTKRTHRLCNLGGTIESLAPEVKDLTRTEMTELMEHIFSLSEVQRAVRHMAITHTNQANREKELKADGTIPIGIAQGSYCPSYRPTMLAIILNCLFLLGLCVFFQRNPLLV